MGADEVSPGTGFETETVQAGCGGGDLTGEDVYLPIVHPCNLPVCDGLLTQIILDNLIYLSMTGQIRGTPDSFITIAQDGNIFWAEKPGFGDFDAEVVFDEQGADAAI